MLKHLFILSALVSFALVRFSSPAAAYIANDRWANTLLTGPTGSKGTPITLTWSITRDGTNIPDGQSGLVAFYDAHLGAGPGGNDLAQRPWFPIFQQSFDRLQAVSGLSFVYEPNDDGSDFSGSNNGRLNRRGDIRIGGRGLEAGSNVLAFNYFPDYGEMVINTNQTTNFTSASNNYRRARNTIMHEVMHGVGVSHVESTSSGFLIEPFIQTSFDGPQLDDILALQRNYGDVKEKGGGNDTFATASPLGAVTPTQSRVLGSLGNSTVVTSSQIDFLSIDDDSDTDFFSFTLEESLDVSLSVNPRGATYQVGPQDGAQSSFNSTALSNLSLALLAGNGTTVLSSIDAAGAGLGEAIAINLTPGNYYARVKGSANDVQLYQIAVNGASIGPDELVWRGTSRGIWDVAVTPNFLDGAVAKPFANGDDVTFNDSATTRNVAIVGDLAPNEILVESAGNYVFYGTGRIVAGSLTVDGSGMVELANSGNSYAGLTNVEAGTLKITGDANAMVTSITVMSGATLLMDASDAAGMTSSILVSPGATLQVGTPTSNANVLSDGPSAIGNNGLMRILDSELITRVNGNGQIVVEQEQSTFDDNALFHGGVTIASGATVEVISSNALGSVTGGTVVEEGAQLLINANSSLVDELSLGGDGGGQGALRIASGRNALFEGDVAVAGAAATIMVEAGASGRFSAAIDAAAADTQLTLHVAADASLVAEGGVTLGDGALVKRGSGLVELREGFAGTARVEQGRLLLAGTDELAGDFHLLPPGTLEVFDGHRFAAASTLSGSGTLAGAITFPGAIAPGETDAAGTLAFTSDLTLAEASEVHIELHSLVPGDLQDSLSVAGQGSLDGALSVDLAAGYTPAAGDEFTFFEADQVFGNFHTTLLPPLADGLQWQLAYEPMAVTLSVAAAVPLAPADFDGDGDVDGNDLAKWQIDFGPTGGSDADNDGDSDGHDFLAWQQQLGSGLSLAASSGAVPEPGALTLVMFVAFVPAFRRLGRAATVVIPIR